MQEDKRANSRQCSEATPPVISDEGTLRLKIASTIPSNEAIKQPDALVQLFIILNMSNYPSSLDSIINQMLSISRRSSIYLTTTIDNIPQIKLSFATPTLATFSSGANSRPDRDRLHPTWVGKPRRQRARKDPRQAKKIVKEKPKWTWAKDCRSDPQRRNVKSVTLSSIDPKTKGKRKTDRRQCLGQVRIDGQNLAK